MTHEPSSVSADHPLAYVPIAIANVEANNADRVTSIPSTFRRMYSTMNSGLSM